MKTVVVGLGNTILGDDGVGWRVAEQILARLEPHGDVQVELASLGGLSLMERLVGFERAILIDAIKTGSTPDGKVSVFPLEALPDPSAGHLSSVHDMSLQTALKAGQKMGLDLPGSITVVAIEATTVYVFSDDLSPAVTDAVPVAVQAVLSLIQPL